MKPELDQPFKPELVTQIVDATLASTINPVFIVHNVTNTHLKKIAQQVHIELGYVALLFIEKDKIIDWDYFTTPRSAVSVVLDAAAKNMSQIANTIRAGGVPSITGPQVLIINANIFKGTNPSQSAEIRDDRAIELNALETDTLY